MFPCTLSVFRIGPHSRVQMQHAYNLQGSDYTKDLCRSTRRIQTPLKLRFCLKRLRRRKGRRSRLISTRLSPVLACFTVQDLTRHRFHHPCLTINEEVRDHRPCLTMNKEQREMWNGARDQYMASLGVMQIPALMTDLGDNEKDRISCDNKSSISGIARCLHHLLDRIDGKLMSHWYKTYCEFRSSTLNLDDSDAGQAQSLQARHAVSRL